MHVLLPPVKWDKRTDGLDFGDLVLWLEDYERSLLPPDTIFPREGQIWETIRDCEVSFEVRISRPSPRSTKLRLPDGSELTVFKSPLFASPPALPCFPGGMTRLQKGERVRIVAGPHLSVFIGPKPLRVSLQPLRYEELHENIVPPDLRSVPGYKGYWLSIKTARPKWSLHKEPYLNEDFRFVEDVA